MRPKLSRVQKIVLEQILKEEKDTCSFPENWELVQTTRLTSSEVGSALNALAFKHKLISHKEYTNKIGVVKYKYDYLNPEDESSTEKAILCILGYKSIKQFEKAKHEGREFNERPRSRKDEINEYFQELRKAGMEFPTVRNIMNHFRITESAVRVFLRKLAAEGKIKVFMQGAHKKYTYLDA